MPCIKMIAVLTILSHLSQNDTLILVMKKCCVLNHEQNEEFFFEATVPWRSGNIEERMDSGKEKFSKPTTFKGEEDSCCLVGKSCMQYVVPVIKPTSLKFRQVYCMYNNSKSEAKNQVCREGNETSLYLSQYLTQTPVKLRQRSPVHQQPFMKAGQTTSNSRGHPTNRNGREN